MSMSRTESNDDDFEKTVHKQLESPWHPSHDHDFLNCSYCVLLKLCKVCLLYSAFSFPGVCLTLASYCLFNASVQHIRDDMSMVAKQWGHIYTCICWWRCQRLRWAKWRPSLWSSNCVCLRKIKLPFRTSRTGIVWQTKYYYPIYYAVESTTCNWILIEMSCPELGDHVYFNAILLSTHT